MAAAEIGRATALGIDLEVLRAGTGDAILLLHGMQTIPADSRFLDRLSRLGQVTAPSSPGFGDSARPKDFDTVYDLVHLHHALLDSLPAGNVTLIGLSFGGWLAAEVAARCPHRLHRLVLVDPLGLKISDRETADILDVFNTSPAIVRQKSWHDPDRNAPDFDAMEDAEIIVHARNRDALCLYGWHPYMHNPRLNRWLGRITVPTLVLWGSDDGVVTPDYGRAYAGLIPGARFELIAQAGHHPEIEQPDALADRIARFISGGD
ncbi:MAG TPA: alpha/beta hydrolase [Acetobacteraceae bacterium]|jgi:pimeloyl-ACP methyl ester carboxylesterase